ncbi:MAG: choice-of-anchor Q domain-containing protein [Bacteroidota bacterium]
MKSSLKYICILFLLTIIACKKDSPITDPSAKLEFSTDTVLFDTVFTTIGSTTYYLKVYNRNKKMINISYIHLAGGSNSRFRMNVDGIPTNYLTDVEIAAQDSMYIFVEVTIDQTSGTLPFIVSDSIVFLTNNNIQDVKLVAWGQDAHFYNGNTICDETWINDKPYVIYNSILVDSSCTLTIEEGVSIYSHNYSGLFVKGTLLVNGTMDEPVTFQGDRLESFYDDVPGQWLGIFILRNSDNNTSIIGHTIIKNALYGVSAGSQANTDLNSFTWDNHPEVLLNNTIIQNMSVTGIFGFLSSIQAVNCLVFNCGEQNAQLVFGGYYDFNHVTLANYGTSIIEHKDAILQLGNFAENDLVHISADLDATFTNCIIYGSIDDEIDLNDDQLAQFNYLFENCLLKTTNNTSVTNYISIINNQDPLFVDITEDDYHLQSTSPCIDAGKPTSVTDDLEENLRDGVPDIGAYEYIP